MFIDDNDDDEKIQSSVNLYTCPSASKATRLVIRGGRICHRIQVLVQIGLRRLRRRRRLWLVRNWRLLFRCRRRRLVCDAFRSDVFVYLTVVTCVYYRLASTTGSVTITT